MHAAHDRLTIIQQQSAKFRATAQRPTGTVSLNGEQSFQYSPEEGSQLPVSLTGRRVVCAHSYPASPDRKDMLG
jgi:hypothetical protein